MNGSHKVDRLLRSKREQGRYDSSGTFSIDAEAAREKIVRFGLEGPESGLLKLLQLAIGARSERLSLRLSRESIDIYVERPKGESFLLNPMSETLSVALLACLYAGYESGLAMDSGVTLQLQREAFEPLPTRNISKGTVRLQLTMRPTSGLNRVLSLLRGRALNHATLAQRLRACPIPVELDGRSIRELTPPKQRAYALDLNFLGPANLRQHGIWVGRDPGFDYRHLHVGSRHHRYNARATQWTCFSQVTVPANPSRFSVDGQPWSKRDANPEHYLANLLVPLGKAAPAQLHFVRHGVIVESLDWEPGWPVSGYVSAAGLDTDASGLKLVHNQKLEDLVNSLASRLAEAINISAQHTLTTKLYQCFDRLG